jgi:hypothetical protein
VKTGEADGLEMAIDMACSRSWSPGPAIFAPPAHFGKTPCFQCDSTIATAAHLANRHKMPGKNDLPRPASPQTAIERESPQESHRNPSPEPAADYGRMMTHRPFCSAKFKETFSGTS